MAIALIIIWVIVFLAIVFYNRIITLKNNRENAFADIDVQLKMRFDLIPNLVETVKGYAYHERETLESVVKARTQYLSADSIWEKIEAENELQAWLKSIFALSENYPNLQANQNFLELQRELSDIENKLAASRRFFNSSTKEYNNSIQTFPWVLFAKMMNFEKEPMFEIVVEEERTTPKVSFQ